MDHGLKNGIDPEYGGVYTEGPHAGGVYDMEKEFWQQAEVMIGMLEACLRFGPEDLLAGVPERASLRLRQDDQPSGRRVVAAVEPRGPARQMDAHEPLVEGQLPHDPLHGRVHQTPGETAGLSMEYEGRYKAFDATRVRTYPLSTRSNKVTFDDLVFPKDLCDLTVELPDRGAGGHSDGRAGDRRRPAGGQAGHSVHRRPPDQERAGAAAGQSCGARHA